MVFTELVLPPFAEEEPIITVVVAPAALVRVSVDPVPPVMDRASKVTPDPVILRLALFVMYTVFVPVAVASVPV